MFTETVNTKIWYSPTLLLDKSDFKMHYNLTAQCYCETAYKYEDIL